MISFGLWVAGMLGKSVNQQQAKKLGMWVAIPLLVIAGALLLWGGKALYDRGVVKQAEQRREAQVIKGARQADQKADQEMLKRAVETERENQRLENAMAEAKRVDPDKGTRTVGNVTQSYFDNLPER